MEGPEKGRAAGTEISEWEYQRLVSRLEFDDTMRNQLLTFSFTTVLAVLGVALGLERQTKTNAFLCLIPFLLILPFEARIAYYRLESAHISSFLAVYAGEHWRYSIGNGVVKEGISKHYGLMAWLGNHEMTLLGMAAGLVFYARYLPTVEEWTAAQYAALALPAVPEGIIFLLANATMDYGRLKGEFQKQWADYRQSQRK